MAPSRPRIVVSANAKPNSGGQGLNLAHVVEVIETMGSVTVFDQRNVPKSRRQRALDAVPLLRRRVDWLALLSDLSFDAHVAQSLPDADVFYGVVGQCARSMAVAKKRGMRTVLDVVNHHVDDYIEHVERESRKFGARSFIHPRMRDRIYEEYALADCIRVLSEVSAQTFVARGTPRSKIVVARPYMSLKEFPVAKFEDPVFRIAFVGLMAPWKGFHLLLEAFDHLKLPDAELVFWGGTGTRSALRFVQKYQARNPNKITMRREVVRVAGLENVYGRASVLALPTLSDGFAYVVSEGMASGLPVITTDNAGPADFIEDGVNGFVTKAGDVRALEERLRFLYDHREKLPEIGACARATIGAHTHEHFRAQMAEAVLGAG